MTITVAVNPNAPPLPSNSDGQPVQVFPAQPHLTAGLQGPLFIEGIDTAPRPLVPGVALPTETSVALNQFNPPGDEAYKLDTLNVFADGDGQPVRPGISGRSPAPSSVSLGPVPGAVQRRPGPVAVR